MENNFYLSIEAVSEIMQLVSKLMTILRAIPLYLLYSSSIILRAIPLYLPFINNSMSDSFIPTIRQ